MSIKYLRCILQFNLLNILYCIQLYLIIFITHCVSGINKDKSNFENLHELKPILIMNENTNKKLQINSSITTQYLGSLHQ